MLENFMAGPVSRDVYRGWKASFIAMGGFEAKAKARVVRRWKSPSADMMGWMRVPRIFVGPAGEWFICVIDHSEGTKAGSLSYYNININISTRDNEGSQAEIALARLRWCEHPRRHLQGSQPLLMTVQ
jgi:hypothetical protein